MSLNKLIYYNAWSDAVVLWIVLLPLKLIVMGLSLCKHDALTEAVYTGGDLIYKCEGECTLGENFCQVKCLPYHRYQAITNDQETCF